MSAVDYGNAALDVADEVAGEFWQARPVLSHVHDFARARMCGPWSTLGVVLARAVASVPPNVLLPGTIGGPTSLNMFVALVGPSGSGKGASEAAAREAVLFVDNWDKPIEIPVLPLGSGEGIARTFRHANTPDDAGNDVDRVLFSVPEVDTLTSLSGRQGATLDGELRKVYSGEAIGFTNAQKATRSAVAANSYRATLTVGVQPLRAGALFAGAEGGTTQRFVWLDVRDPTAPDITPPVPEPWTVRAPAWRPCSLVIPDQAHHAIRRHRLAALRGEAVDPLNGHALLCRLKVAAALMILDGRSVVNVQDWLRAGQVMAFSDQTRTATQNALKERITQDNRARGIAAVEREEAGHDIKRGRAAKAAVNLLRRQGRELSGPEITNSVHSRYRAHMEDALIDLTAEGTTLTRIGGDDKPYYRLADAA